MSEPVRITPEQAAEQGGGLLEIGGDGYIPVTYVHCAIERPDGTYKPIVSARIHFAPAEQALIAAGHGVWLTMEGAEVPWSIDVTDEPNELCTSFVERRNDVTGGQGVWSCDRPAGHSDDAPHVCDTETWTTDDQSGVIVAQLEANA